MDNKPRAETKTNKYTGGGGGRVLVSRLRLGTLTNPTPMKCGRTRGKPCRTIKHAALDSQNGFKTPSSDVEPLQKPENHMAMGQNPAPPVNIPIPTRLKWVVNSSSPKWDPIGFDPQPYKEQQPPWAKSMPRESDRPGPQPSQPSLQRPGCLSMPAATWTAPTMPEFPPLPLFGTSKKWKPMVSVDTTSKLI